MQHAKSVLLDYLPCLLPGSYQITTLPGKGGTGEVYRARDTNLKREIAEVLAPLNHPNVAAF